jgi:hypothetical protein
MLGNGPQQLRLSFVVLMHVAILFFSIQSIEVRIASFVIDNMHACIHDVILIFDLGKKSKLT